MKGWDKRVYGRMQGLFLEGRDGEKKGFQKIFFAHLFSSAEIRFDSIHRYMCSFSLGSLGNSMSMSMSSTLFCSDSCYATGGEGRYRVGNEKERKGRVRVRELILALLCFASSLPSLLFSFFFSAHIAIPIAFLFLFPLSLSHSLV